MRVLINFQGGSPDWQQLRAAGHELIDGRSVPAVELAALWPDLDGAVTSLATAPLMQSAPRLRAVISAVIGSERIDIDAATEQGVLACNSPAPANFQGVAESTVGFMIALNKRVKAKEASVRSGAWSLPGSLNHMLMGQTVGFVGFGRIAREIVKRLSGWDMRFLAYDPYVAPAEAQALGASLVDLGTLLREADFVSLHVVATPETENMIGERELRQMKSTAFLINTSRGQALDEDAFCRAVAEDWIAGGALDVFRQEPLGLESPLRDLAPERVILTPHSVSHSIESRRGGIQMAAQNMLRALAGEVPENVLNPAAIEAWQKRFAATKA